MNQPAKTNGPLVALLVLVGLGAAVWITRDPLGGNGAALLSTLGAEKTACENKARELKTKGIDGRAAYDKAQVANSRCVSYLIGVVDQGWGDLNAIQAELAQFQAAAASFQTWADQQLGAPRGFGSNVDPAAAGKALLEVLGSQEMERRREVKRSLETCRFANWSDV